MRPPASGNPMAAADDDMDWSRLDRYLSGRCTADEREAMRAWACESDARARLLASVERVWDLAGQTPERFDTEAAVRALRAVRGEDGRRGDGHAVRNATLRTPRRLALMPYAGRAPRRWMSLAAAAGLLAVASAAAWHWRGLLARPTVPAPGAPIREFATRPGQRAEVLLTDGTRVWLNVDSRLRVPADFGTTSRDVKLQGEAYFEVAHDARHPFRVHASRVVVQDVGTRFVVCAYAGDSSTAVTVAEGKVALASSAGRAIPLVGGQRGDVDHAGVITVRDHADVDDALAWRDGRLTLHHVPLSRAVRELERWYGVHITLADTSMSGVIVTASFGDDSVDGALRVLSGTLGVRYTRQGTQVRLLPGASR